MFYSLVRQSIETRRLLQGVLLNPCYPSNFIKKLGWGDLPYSSKPSCSYLSVTGDTAKYLVLYSREFVHFPRMTQSAPRTHNTQVCNGRKKTKSGLFSEVGPWALRTDPYHLHFLHLLVTSGQVPTTYLVQSEPIWHAGAHGSYYTRNLSNLFIPGRRSPPIHRYADAPLIPIRPGVSLIKLF